MVAARLSEQDFAKHDQYDFRAIVRANRKRAADGSATR
jgi:hypothetical protein